MRVDVTMPQMGESIAEGTITRWLKKVGDTVQRDEPLFEITTDKVDAEIPSPSEGTVVEIKSEEGETVEVNSVVAVLETDADAAADASSEDGDADGDGADSDRPAADAEKKDAETSEPSDKAADSGGTPRTAPRDQGRRPSGGGEGAFVSPVVRRIAAEHGIDPSDVSGSGAGGRVTKKDILAYIEDGGAERGESAETERGEAAERREAPTPAAATQAASKPSFASGERTSREPMTPMRKKIAEHMVASRRASAHVHSIFEVDLTNVVKLRAKYKDLYVDRHGTKLTYTPFFVRAVCDALRAWPVLNASVDGDEIVYHQDVNVGIAVALDWGLIVPVVRNADELSIVGLCKRVNDLAERARSKKLNPDDVQGGTFTITNPGIYGGLFGLPIINQPQVGILGIGGIEKRPVVIDDAIAIRSMMHVSMSYDHRIVDGAVADQFLARLKAYLESFDESLL